MTPQQLKSKAFSIAHETKHNFISFSVALKSGWKIAKLNAGIPTNITFAKETGELRTATAIAIGSLKSIKQGFIRFLEIIPNGHTQWRSMRFERMIP